MNDRSRQFPTVLRIRLDQSVDNCGDWGAVVPGARECLSLAPCTHSIASGNRERPANSISACTMILSLTSYPICRSSASSVSFGSWIAKALARTTAPHSITVAPARRIVLNISPPMAYLAALHTTVFKSPDISVHSHGILGVRVCWPSSPVLYGVRCRKPHMEVVLNVNTFAELGGANVS